MGLIFGPGGAFSRIGGVTHTNNDPVTNVVNMKFSGSHSMSSVGNMSYMSNGKTISHVGNQFFVGGKTYSKVGDTLFGPEGKRWSGMGMTDEDAKTIIFHDNL